MAEILEFVFSGSLLSRWMVGLFVALVIGEIFTALFLWALRSYLRVRREDNFYYHRPVPAVLMGTIERVFFTVIVAFNISGVLIAMMAWLTLKLATNWNRAGSGEQSEDERKYAIRIAQSALLAGLVSMMFATIGGLICQGRLLPAIAYWFQ